MILGLSGATFLGPQPKNVKTGIIKKTIIKHFLYAIVHVFYIKRRCFATHLLIIIPLIPNSALLKVLGGAGTLFQKGGGTPNP
jgi:hypothetical protein